MKKKLAFVCVLVLLLSVLGGCGTHENTTVLSPELIPFPGTEWNMSQQEVMDALGLKEADCEVVYEGEYGAVQHNMISCDNILFMGYETTVVFDFTIQYGPECGLTEVYVVFPESADESFVKETITAQLGSPQEGGDRLIWESTDLLFPHQEAFRKEHGIATPSGVFGQEDKPSAVLYWAENAEAFWPDHEQEMGINYPWVDALKGGQIVVFSGVIAAQMQLEEHYEATE